MSSHIHTATPDLMAALKASLAYPEMPQPTGPHTTNARDRFKVPLALPDATPAETSRKKRPRKPPVSSDLSDVKIARKPVLAAPTHTRSAFDPRTMKRIVERGAALLADIRPEGILACGHSGLVIGGALSYVTGIPLIAVRKWGEQTRANSTNAVSATLRDGAARRWVWVDDFIASGKTLCWSIEQALKEGCIMTPTPAALLLYQRYTSDNNPNYDLHEAEYGSFQFPIDAAQCPLYGLG